MQRSAAIWQVVGMHCWGGRQHTRGSAFWRRMPRVNTCHINILKAGGCLSLLEIVGFWMYRHWIVYVWINYVANASQKLRNIIKYVITMCAICIPASPHDQRWFTTFQCTLVMYQGGFPAALFRAAPFEKLRIGQWRRHGQAHPIQRSCAAARNGTSPARWTRGGHFPTISL